MQKPRTHTRDVYHFSKTLERRLSSIREYSLTVVEAPSGFGKTTAVQEYLKRQTSQGEQIYWYTCLGEPPIKAWYGICSLFNDIDSGVAKGLRSLEFPTVDTLADMVLLLRKLHCNAETFLVIDNYQLVASNIQRQLLHAFSVHGDKKLHIIFITQPLKGKTEATTHYADINTINENALVFNKESIGAYFRKSGIALSGHELSSIYNSTEGWVSAIRLQMLNYQQRGAFEHTSDIEQLVKMAVWNKLSGEEQTFLLSVCVLEAFTTRQAQMLIQENVIPHNLVELLEDNSFIRYFPEKDLYYIHSILRDFLKNRFYNNEPEEFQHVILKRAGQACAAVADYYPAAQFYYQIREFSAILELPFDGLYLNNQKEKAILEFIVKLVDVCPKETLCCYPMTIMGFAFHLYMGGWYEPFGMLCGLIRSVIEAPHGIEEKELNRIRGEFTLLTSFSFYNDIRKMSEGHRKALQYLDSPSTFLIPTTPWTFCNISVLNMFWSKAGELEKELSYMDECIPYYSMLAKGHGTGADAVMRAEAMLQKGADAKAEEFCHKSLFLGKEKKQTALCLCADLVLARTAMLRGDTNGYLKAMHTLRQYELAHSERFILRMTELCMATLALTLGETEELAEWLYDLEAMKKVLYVPAIPYGHILYGKILLLQKQYNQLYGLSDLMLNMAVGMHYLLPQVYHLIYLAIAKEAQGRQNEAQEHLVQALAIALPDQVYLPFAEHGSKIIPLLESVKMSISDKEGLNAIIELSKRQEAGVKAIKQAVHLPKSVLTPRERDIALLARERLSAKEIAEALFIAESTVRSALKSIYSKLNVHSKAELSGLLF